MGINFLVRPKLSLTPSLTTGGHYRHRHYLDLHMCTIITITISTSDLHHHYLPRPGSTLILTGDFNVMSDGYEKSKVLIPVSIAGAFSTVFPHQAIRYLTGQQENSPVILVDTFRVVISSFFHLENQQLCFITR